MRILGPKEYLSSQHYQKFNEEVFQNEVNWGDSLVGRLFSSLGRKAVDLNNNRSIDGLLDKLRTELSVQALATAAQDNPVLQDGVTKVKNNSLISSLISVIEDNDLKGLVALSKMDGYDEVVSSLKDDEQEYLKSLISSYVEEPTDSTSIDLTASYPTMILALKAMLSLLSGPRSSYKSVVIESSIKKEPVAKQIPNVGPVKSDKVTVESLDFAAFITESITIDSADTHLQQAFLSIKRSFQYLESNDGGIVITDKLLNDLIMGDKESVITLFKEIADFLYGKKSKTLNAPTTPLFKESLSTDKIGLVAGKLARFYKKSTQFESHSDFYSILESFGQTLKSFNTSVASVMGVIKPTLSKINESVDTAGWDKVNDIGLVKSLQNMISDVDVKDIQEQDKEVKAIKEYPIKSINIVKIFNEAARIFIKQRIPSSRTGGKISNSRAEDWEKINKDGSVDGVDPDRPGTGPFRRISTFEKWNDGVLDIVNDFDHVISNAVIQKTDGTILQNKSGESISPLKKFMVDSLDQPLLQIGGGAQKTYLTSHLGLDKKEAEKTSTVALGDEGGSSVPTTDKKVYNWKKIAMKDLSLSKTSFYRFRVSRLVSLEYDFPKESSQYIYFYVNYRDKKSMAIFANHDQFFSLDLYTSQRKEDCRKNIVYCGGDLKSDKSNKISLKAIRLGDGDRVDIGKDIFNITFDLVRESLEECSILDPKTNKPTPLRIGKNNKYLLRLDEAFFKLK